LILSKKVKTEISTIKAKYVGCNQRIESLSVHLSLRFA